MWLLPLLEAPSDREAEAEVEHSAAWLLLAKLAEAEALLSLLGL